MTEHKGRVVTVVSLDTALTNMGDVVERLAVWSGEPRGHYVCAANVHMAMEAYDSPAFREVVNGADLVVPDGVPLVWCQKLLGHRDAAWIPGPELMLRLAERAANDNIPVGLYGATDGTLAKLRTALSRRFPRLQIACAIAPPFRTLTPAEQEADRERIVDSGARILFVGLGCPKQEIWMAENAASIPGVMVGVGAAFDIYAGNQPAAPPLLRRAGLGWLFRLAREPRRLWRRYLLNNPRFVLLFCYQRWCVRANR